MQTRHRHFLRPVYRVSYPRCVMAVDVSAKVSDIVGDVPLCGNSDIGWSASTAYLKNGITHKQYNASGDTADEFWDYLGCVSSKNPKILLVSWHAQTQSILFGFWQRLEDGRIYLSGADHRCESDWIGKRRCRRNGYWVLNNPPTILNFRQHSTQGEIKWIDMRNFGLSELTEQKGSYTRSKQCLITLLDIIEFLRTNNLGSLQVTTGSQSLHSLKYRFLKHSIHVSTNEAQNLLATSSLFGGRNECYRLGEIQGPIAHFDFNSLYPHVYTSKAVPIRLRNVRLAPSDADVAAGRSGQNCIASVLVETDVPCIPKRRGANLIFPVGRFETTVAFPELELAYENCRRIKVTGIATYDMDYPLQEYGETLYGLRLRYKSSGQNHIASYIKALLVSLPGKFGQRDRGWRFAADQRCGEPWKVWYKPSIKPLTGRRRSIAFNVEEEYDKGLGAESVPEITSFVNSWGRRILWEEMCRVGRERIIYVDTDSEWMYAEDNGPISAIHERTGCNLGELRHVATHQCVTMRGLKHYIADGITTPNCVQRYAQFGQRSENAVIEASGIAECAYRRIRPNVRVALSGCKEIKPYTNGRVMSDLTVRPIELEEW